MALNLNTCANSYLSSPGGYPVRLWVGSETECQSVLPKGVTSVTATAKCEAGTATLKMAIYEMPATTSDTDGAMIDQVSASLTTVESSLTLTMPNESPQVPTCYVWRLWITDVTGRVASGTERGDSFPSGVLLSSVVIA